ncbi:gliding motility-associated C-terminal domain-containing protein (plasmid) [Hymenobacter qilianensis]|uniref:Gliding motility-associated C-terminal domain-containing protein n=1 Tax=Hymenobacter qilianensis TaxID=1385715 RepID=A0A7H0H1Y5_9BACT|nr:gliding motility-associated C-terminal domain-containing protein [Hymenobacter qilianensis]QNP54551.1 gliding motility-associated C-terminal domain-containing protein [Hymenobacter qilianensis]
MITEPNRRGGLCAYVDQGVSLGGRQSWHGLPSFMQRDLWYFTGQGTCQGSPYAFTLPITYGADSVRWDFGDPASGRNQSTSVAPTHVYALPGRYLVTLTLFLPGGYPFAIRRYMAVAPRPVVSLGRDTALCPGQALVLTAAQAATYRWQDGSTAATLRAQQPGWYWVEVTNAAGCTTRDSLRLTAAPVPQVRLGADTVLCVGQALTLRPRTREAGTRYRWQDGSTGATLLVNQPGTYWLEGTNAAGCSQRDSLRLFYLTPPTIYLGPDTALCASPEQPFVLDATLPGVRYRWQDGSTAATFTPTQSGTYWVTVSTPVCSATDSIRVRLYDCRQQVFVPNIITPNGDGRNDQLHITGLGTAAWSLSLFSRWGQAVFRTEHYQQDWDAAGLPAGSYYYLLQEPTTHRKLVGWVEVVH